MQALFFIFAVTLCAPFTDRINVAWIKQDKEINGFSF